MTTQLTPTEVLPLFETSKEDREIFIKNIVSAIEEGAIDPLKVHIQIKAMEDIIFGITSTDEKKNARNVEFAKRYRSILLESAQKYGNSFDVHNAKFKVAEVGVKYDYSKCNDPVLDELYIQKKELDARVKEREKFLQNAPISGTTIVNDDTGEATTVFPPSKRSTTSVTVTLS